MKQQPARASRSAVGSCGFVLCWPEFQAGQRLLILLLTLLPGLCSAAGSLLVWGSGLGTNLPPALTNVTAISAGSGHCLALLSNGSVAAWGDNSYFQTNVPVDL